MDAERFEIGIGLPTFAADVELLKSATDGRGARHVEALGFDSVWVPDVLTGDGAPSTEAIVTLAACCSASGSAASRTRRSGMRWHPA